MNTPIISVNAVSKVVQSANSHLSILREINLQVTAGQTVALTGVSGSGKSTLLALLAALDSPTHGRIEVLGQDLAQLDEEARAAFRGKHLGFVFQQFLLIPELTALENLMVAAQLQGIRDAKSRALHWLERVGLSARAEHLPAQLSGGEQQRVALARAFMTQPQIIFADEPTGNLDVITAQQIIDLLFVINQEQGTTLVIVTHDRQLAQRCQAEYQLQLGELQRV